jgi:hypothetical protein
MTDSEFEKWLKRNKLRGMAALNASTSRLIRMKRKVSK